MNGPYALIASAVSSDLVGYFFVEMLDFLV